MPLVLKKRTAPPSKVKAAVTPGETASTTVKVYDIPIDKITLWEENPNVQDDKTFDLLVEKIRTDGFDEPVHVAPDPRKTGWYTMVSGEHRYKAAKLLKFKKLPAIIHYDWDETKRDIEGMARNNLRGTTDPEKFVRLYDKLKRAGLEEALIKAQMGFTKEQAFKKLYAGVEKSVTPAQRKKLQDAKETIKSVDDLSAVLNGIFREGGTDMDKGFLVFSFEGKKHHYVPIDRDTEKRLAALEAKCAENGVAMATVVKEWVTNGVSSNAKIKAPPAKAKRK
jgi:hypothetical protein